MHIRSHVVSLLALAALAACGGGDGTAGDSGGPSTAPSTSKGRFIDSAVQGIAYDCGGVTGTTTALGEFDFVAGSSCTFKVGGITLGVAAGATTLTPVNLVPGAVDQTNATVTNITRFLMALDADGDASNGITIAPAAQVALQGQALDFTAASFDTDALQVLGRYDASLTLPAASVAQAHLLDTLVGRFAGSYLCQFGGTVSGTASITIAAGHISGTGATTQAPTQPFDIGGTVSGSGGANFSQGGTSTGATFQGTFMPDGSGSGQWADTGLPGSGGWTCAKTP